MLAAQRGALNGSLVVASAEVAGRRRGGGAAKEGGCAPRRLQDARVQTA
jgi:hypothetical protein